MAEEEESFIQENRMEWGWNKYMRQEQKEEGKLALLGFIILPRPGGEQQPHNDVHLDWDSMFVGIHK